MPTLNRLRQAVLTDGAYRAADALFRPLERTQLGQNRNLGMIPNLRGRKGGTHTISEWAFTIGMFQSIIHHTLGPRDRIDTLDVGCGTGRLSLAVAPLMGSEGSYTGVDVNEADVAFCKSHYTDPRAEFVHLNHSNRMYAKGQAAQFSPYPFEDESFDLATALSVWTHLNETDGLFYANEVARVLRPGAHAVITFFMLDDDYREFVASRIDQPSPYTFRPPTNYRFDQPVDGSADWLCPKWAVPTPEQAIGVTPRGLARLMEQTGLEQVAHHRGQWKNAPGLFFQDVLVLRKL